MSKATPLTTYKVSKNLTIEARYNGGKVMLFANDVEYKPQKIAEDNMFYSKRVKEGHNNAIDMMADAESIDIDIISKRPLELKYKVKKQDNIYDNYFYVSQYNIESFLGLPTQKTIGTLQREYFDFFINHLKVHKHPVNIFMRARYNYRISVIDFAFRDLPLTIEEQEKYFADYDAKAKNNIDKEYFQLSKEVCILVNIVGKEECNYKALEVAKENMIKKHLATGQTLESLYSNLLLKVNDFAAKALKMPEFQHLVYRDIRTLFDTMSNDNTIEFYQGFKLEELQQKKRVLNVLIDDYLKDFIECVNKIENALLCGNSKDVVNDVISKTMYLLDKKLKCIKYLISLGCQIENDLQLWHDSFMVKSYSYYKKPKIAGFLPNLALELLDFLLESKVLEVGKMKYDTFYKTNDIRMLYMMPRDSADIGEFVFVFFKLLIKHNIFFTQEHLDTLRNTIKLKEEIVEKYACLDSKKYLENVKPLLAFVEANVR